MEMNRKEDRSNVEDTKNVLNFSSALNFSTLVYELLVIEIICLLTNNIQTNQ
jgi:hypothetical protein